MPAPSAPVPTYTVVVNDVPVKDLLFSIARDTQYNIDLHPGITGNVSLNAVQLPYPGWPAQRYIAIAYDSGSEVNDELCTSIPGPFFAECGGSGGGAKVNGGEGFVHVHRGVHGVGDLKPNARDWRNPVAEVRVRLVR